MRDFGGACALVVVDMQRDFMPGGPLGVAGGDGLVQGINAYAARFEHVVLTQDWHPRGHISFAATHGLRAFADTFQAGYGAQALWPEHCVQGTAGAEFAEGLDVPHAELVLRKGFRVGIDSYSAFTENDKVTPTGLAGYLRERGVERLWLVGVAMDYCVGHSALDAQAAGFEARVVRRLTAGIGDGVQMAAAWATAGVRVD